MITQPMSVPRRTIHWFIKAQMPIGSMLKEMHKATEYLHPPNEDEEAGHVWRRATSRIAWSCLWILPEIKVSAATSNHAFAPSGVARKGEIRNECRGCTWITGCRTEG